MNVFLLLIMLKLAVFELLLTPVIASSLKSAEPVHQLSKRDTYIYDCNAIYEQIIIIALTEAETMLIAAEWRLFTLYKLLTRPVVPPLTDKEKVSVKLASTFRTYATLFDPDLETETGGPIYSEPRNSSIARIRKIWGLARMMMIKLRRAKEYRYPKFQITCDARWASETDYEGNRRPRHWYDKRPVIDPGYTGRMWHRGYTLQVDDFAVTLDNMAPPYDTIIALNMSTRYGAEWVNVYLLNRTSFDADVKPFNIMQHMDLDHKDIYIGDLDKEHLTAVLLHELTHAIPITTKKYEMLDMKCPGVNGPYGFLCCYQIAEHNPDIAIKNADSFMFLVIALFLDRYDWSTGYNRELKWARVS